MVVRQQLQYRGHARTGEGSKPCICRQCGSHARHSCKWLCRTWQPLPEWPHDNHRLSAAVSCMRSLQLSAAAAMRVWAQQTPFPPPVLTLPRPVHAQCTPCPVLSIPRPFHALHPDLPRCTPFHAQSTPNAPSTPSAHPTTPSPRPTPPPNPMPTLSTPIAFMTSTTLSRGVFRISGGPCLGIVCLRGSRAGKKRR